MNKIRTNIAMLGTKLIAQVIIKNLQNMHAKSFPPTGARARLELEYQDWARLQGRGPHTGGPKDRLQAVSLQITSGLLRLKLG